MSTPVPPARFVVRHVAGDWVVLDRLTGRTEVCADRPTAEERAAVLEGVCRVLRAEAG